MKCDYCGKRIKKKKEPYEKRVKYFSGGLDGGGGYCNVYFHLWCLGLRGEKGLYKEEPYITQEREKQKRVQEAKEEYYKGWRVIE